MKKIFILDTNVILFDHTAIYNFEDNDVVIPMVALEELDRFKKGNDHINFEARQFVRELDKLASQSDSFFSDGVSLGEGKGRLFVYYEQKPDKQIESVLTLKKADNQILELALYLKEKFPEKEVILVSKDVNLRMKALAFKIEAEDYKTGQVIDVDKLYSGRNIIDNVDPEVVDRIYSDGSVNPRDVSPELNPTPNEYFVIRNEQRSALAHFNPELGELERIEKKSCYGITPRNAEQIFSLDAMMRDDIKLVALTGKAGTGKTLLALAAALEQSEKYRQIYLARPVVPLGNRDMGYLPGNIQSKLDPYMQPLYDNLGVIKHQFSPSSKEYKWIDEMLENEKLFIAPLAYIRGRSLDRIFFIVDEAQNLTPHEVKTIITRAGDGTKIVFTGDIYQIDTPYLDTHSNGLTYLIDKMKGQSLFATVNLVKGERSKLAELASILL